MYVGYTGVIFWLNKRVMVIFIPYLAANGVTFCGVTDPHKFSLIRDSNKDGLLEF